MKTVEELLALCRGGNNEYVDPIGEPERTVGIEGGVYIKGTAEGLTNPLGGDYAEDLLIVIHREGWALFWRDPEGLPEELVHWTREWCGGQVFDNWEELVSSVYEL